MADRKVLMIRFVGLLRVVSVTLLLIAVANEAATAQKCDDYMVSNKVDNCDPEQDGILSSGDFQPSGDDDEHMSSCRISCGRGVFDNIDVRIEIIESNCGICNEPETLKQYVTPIQAIRASDSSRVKHLCIPENVCRNKCNDEMDENCFYSGTCKDILCFKNTTESTIDSVQLTHSGFATQVYLNKADESKQLVPKIGIRSVSLAIKEAIDTCAEKKFNAAVGSEESAPFLDGRIELLEKEKNLQCRIFNSDFGKNSSDTLSSAFEVVRSFAQCNFCNEDDADKYFKEINDSTSVCIPHDICEKECDPAPPGCRYTGTCQSLFCLSGIRSKRPAVFPFMTDDGSISSAVVNNEDIPNPADNINSPPLYQKNAPSYGIKSATLQSWDSKTPRATNVCVDGDPEFSANGFPEVGGGGLLMDASPSPSPSG